MIKFIIAFVKFYEKEYKPKCRRNARHDEQKPHNRLCAVFDGYSRKRGQEPADHRKQAVQHRKHKPESKRDGNVLFAETSSPSPMKLNVGDLVSNHMQRLVNAMFENSAIKNIITASTGDTNFAPLTAMQQG